MIFLRRVIAGDRELSRVDGGHGSLQLIFSISIQMNYSAIRLSLKHFLDLNSQLYKEVMLIFEAALPAFKLLSAETEIGC